MEAGGALPSGTREADGMPVREIRFRNVTFAYPSGGSAPVLAGFDLAIPAGSSLAIVGPERRRQDHARQAAVPALRPAGGAIEIDGIDLRDFDLAAWRERITAVFQDFIRFELPLRDNVAPQKVRPGRTAPSSPRSRMPARRISRASTPCWPAATRAAPTCRAASGSASRSPAPCARCGWAPASCCSTSPPRSSTCAARPRSSIAFSPPPGTARPSSSRIAFRRCATPTASACWSTGRVIELGTHEELMALGGRYRTMFDLQAQRFNGG